MTGRPADLIPTDPHAPAVRRGARAGEVVADRWVLIAPLGAGAGGEVWRARDLRLDEEVAVKLLACDPARAPGLRGEVALARRIAHPAVCRVHELVEAGDRWLVIMERLPGGSLRAALAGAPPARRWGWWRQIVAGAAAAHALGIVHRDLKPDNVVVDGERAVVIDFGLAAATAEPVAGGTPAYLAPEAVAGAAADPRADVFALAVIAIELLAGARPEAGAVIEAAVVAPVAGAAGPAGAAALARVLTAALAVDPAARPAGAVELAAAVDASLAVGAAGPARRRRWPAVVAAVAAAVLAVAAVGVVRARRADRRLARAAERYAAYRALVGDEPALDQLDPAQALLDQVLAAEPDHVPALTARGLLWLKRVHAGGDWTLLARARADLARAGAQAPRDPAVREARCRAERFAINQVGADVDAAFAAAIDACEAALEVAPRSARVLEALGVTLSERCDDERAAAAYERAIAADPVLALRSHLLVVAAALRDGRVVVADQASQRLLASHTDPDAVFHRGAALLARGELDGARAAFERALGFAAATTRIPYAEAAAVRGLLAIERRGGPPVAPALRRRLDELEAGFRAAGDPSVAGAYMLVDPVAALALWPADGTCQVAFRRADLFTLAGDPTAARRELDTCHPVAAWEAQCLAASSRRAGVAATSR